VGALVGGTIRRETLARRSLSCAATPARLGGRPAGNACAAAKPKAVGQYRFITSVGDAILKRGAGLKRGISYQCELAHTPTAPQPPYLRFRPAAMLHRQEVFMTHVLVQRIYDIALVVALCAQPL